VRPLFILPQRLSPVRPPAAVEVPCEWKFRHPGSAEPVASFLLGVWLLRHSSARAEVGRTTHTSNQAQLVLAGNGTTRKSSRQIQELPATHAPAHELAGRSTEPASWLDSSFACNSLGASHIACSGFVAGYQSWPQRPFRLAGYEFALQVLGVRRPLSNSSSGRGGQSSRRRASSSHGRLFSLPGAPQFSAWISFVFSRAADQFSGFGIPRQTWSYSRHF